MQNSNNHNTLAHTTWNCKYHVAFVPKYEESFFWGGEKMAEVGKILRLKRNKHSGGGDLFGPHPHVARDIAQSERVGLRRIFKGEELPDAVRKVSCASIQIQGQGILVLWLLC